MSVERITITIKSETLKKVEISRGLISRSKFIENILAKTIEKNGKIVQNSGVDFPTNNSEVDLESW